MTEKRVMEKVWITWLSDGENELLIGVYAKSVGWESESNGSVRCELC
jgi:hypothetical protein